MDDPPPMDVPTPPGDTEEDVEDPRQPLVGGRKRGGEQPASATEAAAEEEEGDDGMSSRMDGWIVDRRMHALENATMHGL